MTWASNGWSDNNFGGSGTNVDLSDYYTKKQTNSLISAIDLKIIDLSKLYTNAQIDTILTELRNGTYTKTEINTLLTSVSEQFDAHYTKSQIDQLLTDIDAGNIDLSNYNTKTETITLLNNYYTKTNINQMLDDLTAGTPIDLSNYVTIENLNTILSTYSKTTDIAAGYTAKTELAAAVTMIMDEIAAVPIPNISGLATRTELTSATTTIEGSIASVSQQVALKMTTTDADIKYAAKTDIPNIDLTDYAKTTEVTTAINTAIAGIEIPVTDLTGYATTGYVDTAVGNIVVPDISGLVTNEAMLVAIAEVAANGVEATPKSNIEYWLESHPDKTEDDYFRLYGSIVPVTNLVLGGPPIMTSEKRNGKWVYKKLMSTGKMTSAGASTGYSHGIVGADNIWIDAANCAIKTLDGVTTYGPYYNSPSGTNMTVTTFVTDSVFQVYTGANWSSCEYIACIAFTKAGEIANNDVVAITDSGVAAIRGPQGEKGLGLFDTWKEKNPDGEYPDFLSAMISDVAIATVDYRLGEEVQTYEYWNGRPVYKMLWWYGKATTINTWTPKVIDTIIGDDILDYGIDDAMSYYLWNGERYPISTYSYWITRIGLTDSKLTVTGYCTNATALTGSEVYIVVWYTKKEDAQVSPVAKNISGNRTFIEATPKSSLEYYLERNPTKTEDDYFKRYGQFTPVTNLVLGAEPIITNEKRNGKWVYKKLIDFGALPSAAGSKSVAHGIVGADELYICDNESYVFDNSKNNFPVSHASSSSVTSSWSSYLDISNVYVSVGTNRATYFAHICVAFTRLTDTADAALSLTARGEAVIRGKSAYEVALDDGFVGAVSEWRASLRGMDRDGINDDIAVLELIRETRAGEIIYWPNDIIPVLQDGLPKGLPVSGGIVDLRIYPRLDRVLCNPDINSWAPSWFRCDEEGIRDVLGNFIQLDDWRGGYPRIADNGRGIIQHYAACDLVAGSMSITLTNNLAVGTLITPSTSTDGLYPGVLLSSTYLQSDTVVTSVSGTTINIDKPVKTTASGTWIIFYGQMIGGWYGDVARRVNGSTNVYNSSNRPNGCFTSAYYTAGHAWVGGAGYAPVFDNARVVPAGPEGHPCGPATNAIILV